MSPSLVEEAAARAAALPVIEKLIGEHNGAIVARAQEWRDAGHISEDTRRAICALALLGDEPIPVEVMQHLQELHGGPVEDADLIRERIGDARLNRQLTAARAVADAVLAAVGDALRLEGAQARDAELRTIIIQAMKFRPCHEFCSHLWCDKGINEQSLADLLQMLADRGYHNAELMRLEGAQAEHARIVAIIEVIAWDSRVASPPLRVLNYDDVLAALDGA